MKVNLKKKIFQLLVSVIKDPLDWKLFNILRIKFFIITLSLTKFLNKAF